MICEQHSEGAKVHQWNNPLPSQRSDSGSKSTTMSWCLSYYVHKSIWTLSNQQQLLLIVTIYLYPIELFIHSFSIVTICLQNYGDESDAYGLINPSIYSNHGVYEKDFFQPRDQYEVRTKYSCINNANWTEWSAISSEIIRVISKSNERIARVGFEITSMISDQNCMTRSSIATLIY